ncbi:MAG: DUF4440 domain-containing protein [Saprospiraceae bacterium]|nr:DUF4440 domain-containing protein [Saprospiraceae bacterium]
MHKRLYLFLFLFCTFSAFAQQNQRADAAIREQAALFSQYLVAGNYKAVADAYTHDAKIFPPNLEVLTGREAILKYWTPNPIHQSRLISHRLIPQEIKIMGKIAFDWGHFEGVTRLGSGETTAWRGKYVVVWKLNPSGVWKMYLDAWNRSPDAPGLFPASATAQILAPGVLSDKLPEFATALSDDGQTIWFNRTNADRTSMPLLESRWNGSAWNEPQLAAFADTAYRNIDPCVWPLDGRVLFTSNRPIPNTTRSDYNLWITDANHQAISPLPEAINTPDDEIYCGMSQNGLLVFSRFSGAKANLYWSKFENGAFQAPQKINLPGVPDSISISNPTIHPSGNMLVFASRELPGGNGSADLYGSRLEAKGNWSMPFNLGPEINSPHTDFAPSFSPDGKTLFFTSERPGIVDQYPEGKRRPGDIYAIAWDLKAKEDKAIRTIQQQYVDAWLKGDEIGVLSLFEPAARITPSGMAPIDSLVNIGAFWFPKDGSTTTIHAFENEILSLEFDGDMAFTAQKTKLDWSYQKGALKMDKVQKGFAHTVYRRQSNGAWKIWRQTWTDVWSSPK